MSNQPLMPKATAVWLVENTALSFDQIADFCKLHPLEVKAVADGDSAQGIKGLDPIQTGQLTREEIALADRLDGRLRRSDQPHDLAVLELRMVAHQPQDGVGTILAARHRRVARALLVLGLG